MDHSLNHDSGAHPLLTVALFIVTAAVNAIAWVDNVSDSARLVATLFAIAAAYTTVKVGKLSLENQKLQNKILKKQLNDTGNQQ